MTTSKRTVYAVVSGNYSDYQVHVLFEVRADAERAAAELRDGDVEEFVLYPPGDTAFRPRERHTAWVVLNDQGAPVDSGDYAESYMADEDLPASRPRCDLLVKGREVSVQASTREAALKALSEAAAVLADLLARGLAPDKQVREMGL